MCTPIKLGVVLHFSSAWLCFAELNEQHSNPISLLSVERYSFTIDMPGLFSDKMFDSVPLYSNSVQRSGRFIH